MLNLLSPLLYLTIYRYLSYRVLRFGKQDLTEEESLEMFFLSYGGWGLLSLLDQNN